MHVEFLRVDVSSQWSGLLKTDDGHSMQEVRDYHETDIVFSFLCAFVNKATGCTKYGQLMKVNIVNFNLLPKIYGRR